MGDRIHRVCHPGIDISYFIHEIKNNTFQTSILDRDRKRTVRRWKVKMEPLGGLVTTIKPYIYQLLELWITVTTKLFGIHQFGCPRIKFPFLDWIGTR